MRPQFLVVVFVSIFPFLCLYHFLAFVFVGIFPCLCLYRFLGFVSVYRLSSRRPSPFQRRKQRHSYHKYIKNSLTEQHNSHLNKVHLKLQRNWRSAWTRGRNDKRYISKKIKTNLNQEQVLELVAANKVPENLLVELLVAAQVFAWKKWFSLRFFQFSFFLLVAVQCPVPMYLPGI